MNAGDVLKYGHNWFLKAKDGMSEELWDKPGATGTWSPKDILSHLASYEIMLVPVLEEFVSSGKSVINPIENHQQFNDVETAKRKDISWQEILAEYNQAYEKVMELIVKIPAEVCSKPGLLAWYGEEYSLDDYLVYTFYGHKREHGAQIAQFKSSQ